LLLPVVGCRNTLHPSKSARSLMVDLLLVRQRGTPPRRSGPGITHLPGREAEEDCMQSLWRNLWSDESGQGLVEYALIIALVAVGLIAILLVLRNSIGNVFNNAATQLNNAPANPYP
jgi:pilus assembly protein Flp/PilA